jgi:glycosyltransferase involved in cell wall biosynthesis
MNELRVLYLDTPFENLPGGDKNRSRFLWWALGEHFDTRLALIAPETADAPPVWHQFRPLAVFPPRRPPFPRPDAAPGFCYADHRQLLELVRREKFDLVFCRFTVGWELLAALIRALPNLRIVMDVDLVSSRLVGLTWAAHRAFNRRGVLFEKWKLQHFERRLFCQPWLFLFTNPLELAGVRNHVAPRPPPGRFALLPNIMPPVRELNPPRRPVILFFGSLDSSANIDAFHFLVDAVLPKIEPDLKRLQVKIRVVGKNPPPALAAKLRASHGDCVDLTGPVASIEQALAECLFVLLPLRIASGTRTRILEAAALGRAVVTTPTGAEGLDLGRTVLLGDTAHELAEHTRQLLHHPEIAAALGRRLRTRALSLYATGKVAGDLAEAVKAFATRTNATAPVASPW